MIDSRNSLSAGAGSHSCLRRAHSSSVSMRPSGSKCAAGELADAAVELAIGQAQAIGQAVALEDLVPASRRRPGSRSTYQSRSTSFIALRIGISSVLDFAVRARSRARRSTSITRWSSHFASSARPFRPLAKYDAALVEISLPCRSRLSENQRLMCFWSVGRSMPPSFAHVLREPGLLHQLARALDDPGDAGLADEHVVRFLGQHEPRRPRQRIERALRQRQQLRLAVAVGEHREHEEVEPVVDRLVERVEDARLVAIAALAREQVLGLVAAVAAEVRVQQVDHRPEVPAFLDVHLKQVAQVVEARAAVAEPALLLDARGLGVALRDDEPAQLVAELARHFLPDRLAEEIAEADRAVHDRIGEEDAPAVLRQPHVLEVRPARRIDADRGAHVDLVVVLEPLRPHVLPPLDVLRLPVLERALQALVQVQIDVVGNLVG